MNTSNETSPWIHSRPIRSRRGRVVLPQVASSCSAFDVDGDTPAHAWIEAARHAVSSVASFRWAAMSLEAAGAPGDLIQRAFRAADDEEAHAVMFLGFARDHGAPADVAIASSPCELTRHRRRPDNLLETACSALIDGVVAESYALRRFGLAAERCAQRRGAFQTIAAHEETHVELSMDIVMWCVSVRPWIVKDLTLELDGLGTRAPTLAARYEIPDDSLATVAMCPLTDAQRAWNDVLSDARSFLPAPRPVA